MKLIDPVFDREYYPELVPGLYEIFYSKEPGDKSIKALGLTYNLIKSLKKIWSALLAPERKIEFYQKIEKEWFSYKPKPKYNNPFREFSDPYKRIYYQDIIEVFRNELLQHVKGFQSSGSPRSDSLISKYGKPKPNFKLEAIDQILEILRPYFRKEQHDNLKLLIENGENGSVILDFLFAGATLLDFFKQLLRGQFLVIAVQADLERWISDHFNYIDRSRNQKAVTVKYANRYISEGRRAAKGNRLIDVRRNESGSFIIAQLEITNRSQNKNMEEKVVGL